MQKHVACFVQIYYYAMQGYFYVRRPTQLPFLESAAACKTNMR